MVAHHTLVHPIDFEKWITAWAPHINTSQVKILWLIHTNSKTTKQLLSNEVGIGKTAIDNNLSVLKNMQILERVGSDKSGQWQINLILPPLPES